MKMVARFVLMVLLPLAGCTGQDTGEAALGDLPWMATTDQPTFMQLSALSTVSAEALSQRLEQEQDLARKRPLVWSLAYKAEAVGGVALRKMLTKDYGGRQLSVDQEQPLTDSVQLLGFMAASDAPTLEFLTARTHPAAWVDTIKWHSTRGNYLYDMLTSLSIQALGISTSPQAQTVLDRLRERPSSYLHKFAGDIAQAHFYRHLRARDGKEGLLRLLANGDDQSVEFTNWRDNEGRALVEWANEVMRGSLPLAESRSVTDCACKQTNKTCGTYCNYSFTCTKAGKTCSFRLDGISNHDQQALQLAVDKCDNETICD